MSGIYCGIGKIPKKSRLGSMKECAEKKQIRYYGLKKVDSRLVEIAKGTKKDVSGRTFLMNEITKHKGIIKRLKGKVLATKDKNAKEEVKKEIAGVIDKLNKLVKKFNALENQKRSSRRSSRSSSRRSSRGRSHSRSRSQRRNRSRSRSQRRGRARSR